MDKDYEAKYHNIEESNWWFVSRREAICGILYGLDRSVKILDIGCAGGPLLLALQKVKFTNLFGLDFSPEAVEMCKRRGLTNVFLMDAHNPCFEENSFDVLISSDSLEHLERDAVALSNWKKLLKPNGILLVFVPAYRFLWSDHDIVNHHYRRYNKKQLVRVVSDAGFTIEQTGFWNFAMFFPTAIYRGAHRLFSSGNKKSYPKDQLESFNPIINKILISWMKIENKLFNSLGLPIGVSTFVKAKK